MMMIQQVLQIFPYRKWKPMVDLSAILEQLKAERAKLDRAIAALRGVTRKAGGRGRRKLSAAARERIAAAQRARWAKFKGTKRK